MSALTVKKSISCVALPPGSLTLAINAAESRLQLAVGRKAQAVAGPDGAAEIYFAHSWQAAAQGAEIFAVALQNAMALLHADMSSIGRIAAVCGPGGFTGLRLALCSTSALSRGLGAGQAGLEYLPLLAQNAASLLPGGQKAHFCVFTYARRELIYAQSFDYTPASADYASSDAELTDSAPAQSKPVLGVASPVQVFPACQSVGGLEVLRLDECTDFVRRAALAKESAYGEGSADRPLYILGSGLTRNRAALTENLRKADLAQACCLLSARYDQPAPEFLLEAALALPDTAYGRDDIVPLYARASDAEENLESIARKLGKNPQTALARMEQLLEQGPSGHA